MTIQGTVPPPLSNPTQLSAGQPQTVLSTEIPEEISVSSNRQQCLLLDLQAPTSTRVISIPPENLFGPGYGMPWHKLFAVYLDIDLGEFSRSAEVFFGHNSLSQ